jgi:hypothetical protein
MVHDELIAEVAENGAEAAAETLKACLHRAFVETFPGATTLGLVDAQVGAHWAEVHSCCRVSMQEAGQEAGGRVATADHTRVRGLTPPD